LYSKHKSLRKNSVGYLNPAGT